METNPSTIIMEEIGSKGGYTKLAQLMGAHPDVAIFQRFRMLNVLSLLHMQAELRVLELDLQDQAKDDAKCPDTDKAMFDQDWRILSNSEHCDEVSSPSQWQISQRITEKLHEYNKALLQQHELLKIGSPAKQDLGFLRDWMRFEHMGNVQLLSPDKDIWDASDLSDLICLCVETKNSPFVRFIGNKPIRWYHSMVGWLFKVRIDYGRNLGFVGLFTSDFG
ncbi:hypothetical protein SUNI508_06655 [Seiridium unicorne]|uniref:DUF6594 domain-containing protein n=1 Tax=Seiridium unicorne TaxID=138068 RepID=A0ABR2UZL9_9PEZI